MRLTRTIILLCVLVPLRIQPSWALDVAFAGLAFSGEYQSLAARFPYSQRLAPSLQADLRDMVAKMQPKAFSLVARFDELKNKDQVIAVALVVNNETVSVEQFGPVYKLFVQVRGQALFFDFKSMAVLSTYPFSFAYIDRLLAAPTEDNKIDDIRMVFSGKDAKPGILQRFKQAVESATLPTGVSRYLQVTSVSIGEDARSVLPLAYAGDMENWVADVFGEAIASRMGVSILPYSKGYAIGNVMSMTVSDGTVFSLKLPQADYQFILALNKLKKVTYEEQAAGKSFIYATFASIRLIEPLSNRVYLDDHFKNGETKVVPRSQVNTDDFPAFQDSIRGLFTKLAGVIAGDKNPWIESSASGKEIGKQILSSREVIRSCK